LRNNTIDYEPEFRISNVLDAYRYGAGVIEISTHGSSEGHTIEVYAYDSTGMYRRDSAYVYYCTQGLSGLLYADHKEEEGHYLGLLYSALPAHIGPPYYLGLSHGIFHNQCCYGGVANNVWLACGAATAYGPNGSISTPDGKKNVEILWNTLGTDWRMRDETCTTGQAHTFCPNLTMSGAGNLVLGPAVKECSHESGDEVPPEGLLVTLTTDTDLDQTYLFPPSEAVDVSGVFTLTGSAWTGSTELEVTVLPTGEPGDGSVIFRADGIVSADCFLLGLNGGADYGLRLVSGDDPAASVTGFSIVDGTARWKVLSEYRTERYLIEGAPAPGGPWTPAAQERKGAGHHAVPISESPFPYYRLIELETTGKRIFHGIAVPGSRGSMPSREPPPVASLKQRLRELEKERPARGAGSVAESMGEAETYVIFTVEALRDAVELYVATYWEHFGYDAVVKTVDGYPSDPEAFRAALKDTIASLAAGGARYFHLIGDANDWQWFSEPWPGGWEAIRQDYIACGYPAGGQPEKDLIPTWSFPDTLPRNQNTSWLTPYSLTDRPYADTDGDGVPDVVLGRWPVTEEWEVLALAAKMQQYMDEGVSGGAYTVLTCVGDLDHDGEGDGAYASTVADTITAALPPDQSIVWIYESDFPYDDERNIEVAARWNTVDPDLVLTPSSYSNRSWPGNYFDQTNMIVPFHMGMISDGTSPAVVVALSCDGADFARTEDPEYGLPMCYRFLVEPDKGAIAWIGPMLGSWQNGNEVIARYFIGELYNDLDRPVAESYLMAVQRVFADYAEYAEILRSIDMYVFLGDPLSRFRHFPPVTAVADSGIPGALELRQNYPNPFNPITTVQFATTVRGFTEVTVYDVQGRVVKRLVGAVLPPGSHAVSWNGSTDDGSPAASGVYFLRLWAEGRSMSRKLVLLR
jgi:hypothetical protein